MNRRQAYALTHPLNRALDATKPEYAAETRIHGLLVRTVLAVDR
jgi:hypothetical protein